eukprot:gene8573-10276_t
MSSKAIIEGVVSPTRAAARHRVIGLYRAWYRSIPQIIQMFRLEKTQTECQDKGKMELEETLKLWKQKTHVMRFWEDPAGPKPQPTFYEKFIRGR